MCVCACVSVCLGFAASYETCCGPGAIIETLASSNLTLYFFFRIVYKIPSSIPYRSISFFYPTSMQDPLTDPTLPLLLCIVDGNRRRAFDCTRRPRNVYGVFRIIYRYGVQGVVAGKCIDTKEKRMKNKEKNQMKTSNPHFNFIHMNCHIRYTLPLPTDPSYLIKDDQCFILKG